MIGFTKIDNPILEKILTADLTKRQLKMLLLIVRFSYGYQKTYAILRRSDFLYAGLLPSCITSELKKLSHRGVIGWDITRDLVWINSYLGQWSSESARYDSHIFFKIAAKNSPKWQLAICQNSKGKVDETASVYKKRNKKITKDTFFSSIVWDYFLKIAPLSREESEALRELAGQHGVLAVTRAIHSASLNGARTFPGFLKELDRTEGGNRQGGLSTIGSSVQRFKRIIPRR